MKYFAILTILIFGFYLLGLQEHFPSKPICLISVFGNQQQDMDGSWDIIDLSADGDWRYSIWKSI